MKIMRLYPKDELYGEWIGFGGIFTIITIVFLILMRDPRVCLFTVGATAFFFLGFYLDGFSRSIVLYDDRIKFPRRSGSRRRFDETAIHEIGQCVADENAYLGKYFSSATEGNQGDVIELRGVRRLEMRNCYFLGVKYTVFTIVHMDGDMQKEAYISSVESYKVEDIRKMFDIMAQRCNVPFNVE